MGVMGEETCSKGKKEGRGRGLKGERTEDGCHKRKRLVKRWKERMVKYVNGQGRRTGERVEW